VNRFIASGMLVLALSALGACAQKQPSSSTTPAPAPTDSAKVDPEDPKAGTNTARPDSIKDVKPEADSGKTPSPP
jgi:hypothetical protein